MWVLTVMTLSSPLSLSLFMQDNEQVSVDDRKELGHCGQKGHLLLLRFSSIYGAFHCKQTSNAGGFCVHVVSQLVV